MASHMHTTVVTLALMSPATVTRVCSAARLMSDWYVKTGTSLPLHFSTIAFTRCAFGVLAPLPLSGMITPSLRGVLRPPIVGWMT